MSAPALDRVSFFDQPRKQIGPLAYGTAIDVVAGKSSGEILDYCMASFSAALVEAHTTDAAFVGPTVLGAMRIENRLPPAS